MQLLGTDALDRAARKHRDARSSLQAWRQVVADASWRDLMAVRVVYPHADGVGVKSGAVVTVFNIGGGKYRLLTTINYKFQIVRVIEMLTHAEYDKNRWKERL